MPQTLRCPILFANHTRCDLDTLNGAIKSGALSGILGDHHDLPKFLDAIANSRVDFRGELTPIGELVSETHGGVYSKPFYSGVKNLPRSAPIYFNRAWDVFILSTSFCNGITEYTVMVALKDTGSIRYIDAEQISVTILHNDKPEARLEIKPTGCPGTQGTQTNG